MQQLVYVSTASAGLRQPELLALLDTCRRNNEKLSVTGMLLLKDLNFMQVLEGDDAVVDNLFARIAQDPRHHGILKIFVAQIEQRDFAEWSMAFRHFKDPELARHPGYSEFLNVNFADPAFAADTSRAKRLLKMFRTTMR